MVPQGRRVKADGQAGIVRLREVLCHGFGQIRNERSELVGLRYMNDGAHDAFL
jgi:hypothetical protein